MSRHLYHGTGIYCLASIIERDCLLEGAYWGKPGEPHGPRLTEDFDVAAAFIEYNAYCLEGGVLVLNRDLLESDYQLVSYEDKSYEGGDWGKDEKEIVPVTSVLNNVSRYLVSIVCDPDVIRQARHIDNVDLAMAECGWVGDWGDDTQSRRWEQALNALEGSQHLNRWLPPDRTFPALGNWIAKSPIIETAPTGTI